VTNAGLYSLHRFSQTRAASLVDVSALCRAVVAFADEEGATLNALGSIGATVGEALDDMVFGSRCADGVAGSLTVDAHRELTHLAVAVIYEGRGFERPPDTSGLGPGMPVIRSLDAMSSYAPGDGSGDSGVIVLMAFVLN